MIHSGQVQYHDALEPMLRPIDDYQPHPANYNNGDTEAISESITINGMYRPIYVQKSTGYIVAGNHTWMTCKQMNANLVPVVELDVDDMTALRLLPGDNEIAKKARPDHGQLLTILETLNEQDTILGSGVNEQELIQLRALVDMQPDYSDPETHAQWPLLCFQVPPHVKSAYLDLTSTVAADREKFELLLRLAGWEGR